jgi:hypothetical protein
VGAANAKHAANEKEKSKVNLLRDCERRKFTLLETARNNRNGVENLQHDRTMIRRKRGESKLAEV